MRAWFNRVFTELLPENTRDQSRFEPIPLEEAPEPEGAFGGVYTYIVSTAKDAPEELSDPRRVLEVIRGLVLHPEHRIRDRKSGKLREIRYGLGQSTRFRQILELFTNQPKRDGVNVCCGEAGIMNRYIERWWQNTTSLKGVRIVHALFIFCKEARISLPPYRITVRF